MVEPEARPSSSFCCNADLGDVSSALLDELLEHILMSQIMSYNKKILICFQLPNGKVYPCIKLDLANFYVILGNLRVKGGYRP